MSTAVACLCAGNPGMLFPPSLLADQNDVINYYKLFLNVIPCSFNIKQTGECIVLKDIFVVNFVLLYIGQYETISIRLV